MKRTKCLKIKADKTYPLEQSPLFKLYSLDKLFKVLQTTREEIDDLLNHPIHPLYRCYKNAKGRDIQEVDKDKPLYKIHNRIASLLCRIQTPDYILSGKKGCTIDNNASAHRNAKMVLNTDISKFFPSTDHAKVLKFFHRKMKCTQEIAEILSTLCLLDGKLPTGSQISMVLAVLVNRDLFNDLDNFAKAKNLTMTVWVDDITFSGDNISGKFKYNVIRIIEEYGYCVNTNKTRLLQPHQIKSVTGIYINTKESKPNGHYMKIRQGLKEWNKIIKDLNNTIDFITKKHKRLIGLLAYSSHHQTSMQHKERITTEYEVFLAAKTH